MTDTPRGTACERPDATVSEAQQAQAMHLGIAFDGHQFVYHDFKYDRLPDAVAYAELEAARGEGQAPVTNLEAWHDRPVPSAAERVIMQPLGIRFEGWRYRYHIYRYDRLADALNYARG
ncbi:MAG: hypothetical protein KA603_10705 [Azonexus sp.]|jgi:hypothetical protein|nr:hypothetical protein [Betaproteobacteria bacterium]MBK8919086.1 hypothetical protein [Betaproteobacteria bacterium]MBP6036592.1 hypothetical protein [Azonexus sp.]MBP6907201.1 hypothetical protein [Azonexus sp.]